MTLAPGPFADVDPVLTVFGVYLLLVLVVLGLLLWLSTR